MELRKESVQMLQIKSRAASQVTFDTDYNVPDAKPDVGRLIQNKGDVSMDEVRLSEGKAFISGNLNVDILYVGEADLYYQRNFPTPPPLYYETHTNPNLYPYWQH